MPKASTAPEPTVRDLCCRWRYTEAMFKADSIILDDDNAHDRLIISTDEQLKAIEEQILAAEPAGAGDAAEILHVVLELLVPAPATSKRRNAAHRP